MKEFFVCRVICEESKDIHFSVGTVYEVIEINDSNHIRNEHGYIFDAYMFNDGIVAACESKFKEI